MADTPLESVPGWSEDHISRLKNAWITTAEQVVALGATPRGIRSLSEQLGVSEREAFHLVGSARMQLPPEVLAEMESVVDPSEHGLGALDPDKSDQSS